MGIKLYVDVLDHAPAELTSNERLLLLVLAEKANDDTRRAVFPNPDRLLHRVGMSEDGLRKVCQKLAARGYEVRIPVGTNKAGRPVYAYKGHAVDYRVPVFPRRDVPPERRDNSTATNEERQDSGTAIEDVKAGQMSAKAGQMSAKGGTDVRKGGTDVPPLPSDPSDIPQIPHRARVSDELVAEVVDALRARTGKTVEKDHAAAVARQILDAAPTDLRAPIRYVTQAIRKDNDPYRFLPTPQPPRYQRETA